MTRDDIIRMAREAGLVQVVKQHDDGTVTLEVPNMPKLERFAELVAAAERERLNKKIAALESDVDHFFKLSGQYLERANKAEEALAAERDYAKHMGAVRGQQLSQRDQLDWWIARAIEAAHGIGGK